jgi:hypothetical protein
MTVGFATATAPVTLVSKTEPQPGVLIFEPIALEGSGSVGFAWCAMGVQPFLDRVLAEGSRFGLEIEVRRTGLGVSGSPMLLAAHSHLGPDEHLAAEPRHNEETAFERVHPAFIFGRRGNGARMEQAGFSGYLTKPLRHPQLHGCLAGSRK